MGKGGSQRVKWKELDQMCVEMQTSCPIMPTATLIHIAGLNTSCVLLASSGTKY